jgi:hypothetical protein
MCQKYSSLSPDKSVFIKEICCGDINCKEGVHSQSELVCIDNLLTGKCDCLSQEEIEEKQAGLMKKCEELQEQIDDPKINKKLKADLINQYNEIVTKYNMLVRKKHLTEQGLVPLIVRLDRHKATPSPVLTVDTVEVKKVARIVKKVK